MNTTSHLRTALRRILLQPTNGVVGIVDELLAVRGGQNLQFDWHEERGHLRALGGDGEPLFDEKYRKSVFRAILARVAAICNERMQPLVSPYGGEGHLTVDTNPLSVVRVVFVNTPDTQTLELSNAPVAAKSTNGTVATAQNPSSHPIS